MPAPTFPNVPQAPGVPPVQRGPDNAGTGTVSRLTRDSAAVSTLSGTEWGVYFTDGGKVLSPDSIAAVTYGSEYRIADYPIEKGGFASYDKVALPFVNRVTMAKGGTLSERQAFLRTLEAIKGRLELYNVITPEAIYRNVNIERVTLERTATNGATMLTVEVQLREVRQSATVTFTNSKTASAQPPQNNGSVQPQPTPAPADDVR